MCGLPPGPPLGMRRVERPRVRYERLNRFAADRMLAAQTPAAHRFWKRILGATVTVEETWVRDEAFYEAFRQPPYSNGASFQ